MRRGGGAPELHEKTCPVCGRRFYVTDLQDWVFQGSAGGKQTFWCRWSCKRKWEKEHPPKKKFNYYGRARKGEP